MFILLKISIYFFLNSNYFSMPRKGKEIVGWKKQEEKME
jgi:hypothetical protein